MKARILRAAAAAVCAFTGTTYAGIVAVGGQATLIARPTNAREGAITSNTSAFVWNEAQDTRLGDSLAIDAASAGSYATASDWVFGTIASGTLVSSHVIHFDTVGTSSHTVEGSITLSEPILGIIGWNRVANPHLDASDSALGLGTLFSVGVPRRGIFDVNAGTTPPQDDSLTISNDLRTLSFKLTVSTPFDEVRVVTGAVPEPAMCTGLGLIALGLFGRRRPL